MSEPMASLEEHDIDPPGPLLVGQTGTWVLPLDDFVDGKTVTITGKFLGLGSSKRPGHINHDDSEHAPKGTTCSACRWFESRIFRETGTDAIRRYMLFYVGETRVPGEEPRYRYEWLISPYEVIDALTTVQSASRTTPGGADRRRVLSYAARRVLAQAASTDDDLRDAYEGRMTTL